MYEQNTQARQHIQQHIQVMWDVYFHCIQDIIEAADLITTAFKNGNKLLLCGNGGSAADCQHLAAEFVPMGLPAIALTTDTSFLTAYSNDHSFNDVFMTQIFALGEAGDVVMGISTSGRSQNIIKALIGNSGRLHTIALTGMGGIASVTFQPTVSIKVPSTNTQHIQEAHITIEHLIWQLVKEAL